MLIWFDYFSDINECSSDPCQNGGICLDQFDHYNCECNGTGYTGSNCEGGKW